MSVFRLPNIGDGPEKEQLRQLKSYLYQLVEQLNLELETTRPAPASTDEKNAKM